MSNEQDSPWSSGQGFGTPQSQPKPDEEIDPQPWTPVQPAPQQPVSNYQNPTVADTFRPEPMGWSEPQQFGALQPAPGPTAPMQFGQQVPYGYGAPLLPEHPNSTLVLVLGIVGLVTNFFALPFISPIAWYLGAKARRDIARYPGVYRDNGRLTAGLTLGIIGTLLALVFIGFIVVVIILAIAAS